MAFMLMSPTAALLFLSMVIAVSTIAFIQLARDNSFSINLAAPSVSPAFYSQLNFNIAREAPSTLLSNSTRAEIYGFIVANPGIQFRGICAGLGIAIGTAEFHSGVLKKAGLISFVNDGKYKRFFAKKKFSEQEKKVIAFLRHQTAGRILRAIWIEKTVSHCKLASSLSITSQGLTWQMNRLRKEEIVQEAHTTTRTTYTISEEYIQVLNHVICIVP